MGGPNHKVGDNKGFHYPTPKKWTFSKRPPSPNDPLALALSTEEQACLSWALGLQVVSPHWQMQAQPRGSSDLRDVVPISDTKLGSTKGGGG